MPSIYKRNCDFCKSAYVGRGKLYCSNQCAAQLENKKRAPKISKTLSVKYANGEIHKRGTKHSDDWKIKASQRMKGENNPSKRKEVREKLSGVNCHLWKGGITEPNKKIRNSFEYREWRKAVFERDNYTCQHCQIKSSKGVKVYLEADHIKQFATHPELRFDVTNGRTLCKNCHIKTETYGNKRKMRMPALRI